MKNGFKTLCLGTGFNRKKIGSRELYLGSEFNSNEEWI